MKKLTLVVALLALVMGAALAQEVIKYELTGDDGAGNPAKIAIGTAVKLYTTDNTCTIAGAADGDDVIGFVAMAEGGATDTFHLVVNAGRLTSIGVTEAVTIGDELSISTAGSLKVAGAGDRVIAIAMQDAAAQAACEIMIQLEPIASGSGAKLWQVAVAGAPVDITGTAAAKQQLLEIDMTGTDCDVENMKIQFTGTVDDKASAEGGAVVNVEISEDGDPGTGILASQSVYLVDRNFHQRQAMVLTINQDVVPTNEPIYHVNVWETEGLTNGQVAEGILTVVGMPRD